MPDRPASPGAVDQGLTKGINPGVQLMACHKVIVREANMGLTRGICPARGFHRLPQGFGMIRMILPGPSTET